METAKEREASFRKDLQLLLDKHGAEMRITDDGKAYGMHSAICVIEMDGSFDYDQDKYVKEYCEFEL